MRTKRKSLPWVSVLLFVSMVWFLLLPAGSVFAQVHDYDISSRSPVKEGSCWQPIGPALATDWYVRQVAASPNFAEDQTLFAATGSNNLNDLSMEGVFVSRDGGKNWRHVLERQRVTVIGVSPDFARDGTVIAANTGGKVFISQDQGETWQGTTDIPSNTAWALAISPTFSADKTVFLGGANGLLVSTDGGYHWQSLSTELRNVYCIAVSPGFAQDRTLFVGATQETPSVSNPNLRGLYRSRDGGKTWEQVGLKGLTVKEIALSPDFVADQTAYAVCGNLYKSTDGGSSWESITVAGANGICLALSPNFSTDRTVFVGTDGLGTDYYDGVLRCRDGLQERLVCGLLGKTERDLVAVAVNGGLQLFAAVTHRDRLWGEVYTLTLEGQGQPQLVTKEGLVQRGIEYPYWLAVQTEDVRYALLQDPAHSEEYAKLKELLGKRARVTGYLDTGPGFPDPVQGHIRVIKVDPLTEPDMGQPKEVCRFKLGSKSYTAGGKTYPMDVAPYVKNDRTYLSIRYLANALGVRDQDITWNPKTKTAILKKGNITLYFMVGSREMMRTDASTSSKNFIQMDVAPEIRNSRLCLPARYVAEGFGYQVKWEANTQNIIVTSAGSRGETTTSSSSGAATIQFAPYSPVDLNGNTGFVEGHAGGIQFTYLPVQQVVWGYRVYIDYPAPPGNQWEQDPDGDGYYCDFKAHYSPVGYTGAYREPDPQSLVLEGLTPGTQYHYKVLPLCITNKAPWNLDKNGKAFQYGFIGSADLSFIWVYTDHSDWGVVIGPGGEPEKGYYLVHYLVAEGTVTAQRAGGGGGGGGHVYIQ
ncbi:MAG: stalk domain-containing protein [Bacillota bacterium]|nr:stalk domain-containing protein [Thermoanaerobacteraceae bacterium]